MSLSDVRNVVLFSAAMESEAERSSGSGAATLTPCSPYFLDSALPSDDHHSSEEELEVINAADKGKGGVAALSAPVTGVNGPGGGVAAPEKRKWSQVAALLAVEAASSSDDEVQGLLAAMATPVRFRTWPPLDAHKPGRSLSPPPKLFHYAGAGAAAGGDASPRKRHRHTPRASHIQRPCLDFEKMQQVRLS